MPSLSRKISTVPFRDADPGVCATACREAFRAAFRAASSLIPLFGLLMLLVSVTAPVAAQSFPSLSGRIVDQAGLLDAETAATLDAMLTALEEKTSNQIVLVTVNSLDGYDIADYANRLGRAWGIGSKEKDNGVILLIAPNERKVRIEVGYGLEGALTDGLSGQIIRRQILPAFKEKDYPRGIQSGIQAIEQAIAGEYKLEPATRRSKSKSKSALEKYFPLLFIGIIAIPELLRRFGKQRLANGAFPAGFAGMLITLFSGNVLIGLFAGIVIFLLLYFGNRGGGGGSPGYIGTTRGGLGGGFGGGGGFSGGGGSFGGGGASGSW